MQPHKLASLNWAFNDDKILFRNEIIRVTIA